MVQTKRLACAWRGIRSVVPPVITTGIPDGRKLSLSALLPAIPTGIPMDTLSLAWCCGVKCLQKVGI